MVEGGIGLAESYECTRVSIPFDSSPRWDGLPFLVHLVFALLLEVSNCLE